MAIKAFSSIRATRTPEPGTSARSALRGRTADGGVRGEGPVSLGAELGHRFARMRISAPTTGPPIQRAITNTAKKAAYKVRDLHSKARDKYDHFLQQRAVRQGRAVLGFLGIAGGTHGDDARYAFKSQARLSHAWNKFWGGGPSAGPEGGAPDETAIGGKPADGCCADKGPFPKDRFARPAGESKAQGAQAPTVSEPTSEKTTSTEAADTVKAKPAVEKTQHPALERHRQRLEAGRQGREALRQRLDEAAQNRQMRAERRQRFVEARKRIVLKGLDPKSLRGKGAKARVQERLKTTKGSREQRVAARQQRAQQELSRRLPS